eukprot:Protomagalhaensia_sp_Gyna_25__3610@NODE_3243_length_663_cov_107_649038_g2718_i0_p1_GENE_NODE_3243_length_663_cov_107_649038_g2718_i0NODE_3243_length_663_cov_107_649038_g2718_i0_p1_ORF_typecomplete_len142_score20_54_NODE_3243_length_663_cov_107_649038_g2718_i0144569
MALFECCGLSNTMGEEEKPQREDWTHVHFVLSEFRGFITWMAEQLVSKVEVALGLDACWPARFAELVDRRHWHSLETGSPPASHVPVGGWSVIDGEGNMLYNERMAALPYERWVREKAALLLGYQIPEANWSLPEEPPCCF